MPNLNEEKALPKLRRVDGDSMVDHEEELVFFVIFVGFRAFVVAL